MNINYLVLKALKKYYMHTDGPYKEAAANIYTQLRKGLISNAYRVYKQQGALFENYNPKSGRGMGQHPFSGWSALILLIMAEIY